MELTSGGLLGKVYNQLQVISRQYKDGRSLLRTIQQEYSGRLTDSGHGVGT